MSSLNYLVPNAARVRKLASEVEEPNKSLLLKLAEEIDANGGRVRVRFTRNEGQAIDVDTGARLLQQLEDVA